MSKLPVSVVMVVYHGETTLERCLRSCADLVDEIIVVHDGPCQDRSLEISRRYTDRVYVGERAGAAEPHRVLTYTMATHEWILQLDQDEFLSEGLRAHLADLIREPNIHGVEFAWPTWYRGHYHSAYVKIALVRKAHFYFIGAASEHLKPLGPHVRIVRVPDVLEHKPTYDNLTWLMFRKKWVRLARSHGADLLKEFSSIPKYQCPLTDWEPRTRLRIDHPVLLGMGAMFLYTVLQGFAQALRTRDPLFVKAGVFHGLYFIVLYQYVWRQRAT